MRTLEKAAIHTNASINKKLNYAPLTWMIAVKTVINKICKSHSYDELLKINKDISIH